MVLMGAAVQPAAIRSSTAQGKLGLAGTTPSRFAAMRYTESAADGRSPRSSSPSWSRARSTGAPNFDGTLEEAEADGRRGLPHVAAQTAPSGHRSRHGRPTSRPTTSAEIVGRLPSSSSTIRKLADDLLYEAIPGPDFPTDAEIVTSRQEIRRDL